jgi:hypothetical protein
MSTPSLLNIPYLYKAGTLYSQIPESGAGDFTVSRTTTVANRSTRINKNGLIELVNDNVPRLDYPVGGAVNGCPALLVEPSAINICLRSTWEGGGASPTGWSPFTSGGTSTPIASLLGNDSVAYSFSTTASQRVFFSQTITISNATNYTFSFYVESIATGVRIDEIMLFQSGASSVVFVDPDGITISATTVISKTGRYQVRMLSTATSTTIRVGSGVSNNIAGLFALSRPQLEVGSVATSYIPTTTAAVTRSADVIRKTNITSLIGQSEGTVYFEVEVTNEARTRWAATVDSGNNDFIQFFINSSRVLGVSISKAGATVMTTLSSSALSVGYHKVAFAYNTATNGCEMFIDGVQNPVASRTVTGAGLPALSNFTLGSFTTSGSDSLKAHIRADAIHPNRLTNAQLATLTAP